MQLDGRGIKNPVYYNDSEVDGGRGGSGSGSGTGQTHDDLTPRQPTELYNTLVQVGVEIQMTMLAYCSKRVHLHMPCSNKKIQ